MDLYSTGSGNLTLGVDNLDGVGLQLIGDNDERHFIFTTDNGGLLDVKTDKFFIGTTCHSLLVVQIKTLKSVHHYSI